MDFYRKGGFLCLIMIKVEGVKKLTEGRGLLSGWTGAADRGQPHFVEQMNIFMDKEL
jgi:hypothetical protein